MYDLGDRILMVASDRISTYDVVHPTPIPDKGAVLTGLSAFWFGETGHIVDQPLRLGDRGRARRRARPRDGRPQAADAARRVRRARLHHRLGLEGLPGDREGLGHRAAARPARVRAAARRRSSRPSTKADEGHDEAIDFERAAELVGDRELMARVRDVSIALYAFAAEHAARARRDPRRHEVRVRPRRRRRARRRRRGADARLVALLAGRRLRARPAASRASTSSTCATGPRAAAGTRRRRRRRCPTTSSPGTRGRYVEAYERITGEPFDDVARRGPRHEGARPHPPQGGDPRPAGHRGRARAARARVRGRVQRPRRAAGRARRRGRRAARRRCAGSCWPTR